MMRLLLAATVFLSAMPAHAITRYNSTSMSCDEVRGTIRQDGAAIMRYRSTRNPSLQLFGRYVLDDRFCRQSERAETVFIPSADRKSCPVYECKPFDIDDDFPVLRLHRFD
ncbi:hypothetical protein SAMN04488498_12270 [Mesorhizobium albiziae]|uniref:KTSC domain-containing protein n=2 Tax=Neomesorhizobium albiziae TaxID=335020 RepID=A0A1I4E5N4_9HYPH|nr:hypothetical protein GCM10007937_41750 [Mesorhizobium albiziae]SFL00583.1 hypothetical protein SAMN04488498_12270 [Mesorhizobium albiziae]